MKIKLVKFICNNCDKEEVREEDNIFNPIYPYKEGWIFMYNMEFKTEENKKLRIANAHFCSNKCLVDHIKKFIQGDKKK